MSYKILVVDDDAMNIAATADFLEMEGYIVHSATSLKKTLKLLSNHEFALVLLDFHMPGMNGCGYAKEILEKYPDQMIVMHSNDDSRETTKISWKAGAVDFIDKNIDPLDFTKEIAKLCRLYEQTRRKMDRLTGTDRERLITSIGMVGRSNALAKIALDVNEYAKRAHNILITGETGTGKELVANALHLSSDRADKPFVPINCAAIPKDLLESHLFGHRQGAFTGANKDQPGKFMSANNGTIFLDEIGDMPFDLQAKLLRVLQERTIEPVGSSVPKCINVRVIAATHKNLKQLVAVGQFREDLYFRLNELSINIPPLRDRTTDIELLINFFVDQYCAENGQKVSFTKSTLPYFKDYRWNGNVRELKSIVTRTLILSKSSLIGPKDLDKTLFKKPEKNDKEPKATSITLLDKKYDEDKRKIIQMQLRSAKNKTQAAKQLEISPSRLDYYLKRYDLC